MNFKGNAPLFSLTIFLIGEDHPVNENFSDPGDLLDSLERWMKEESFGSAHISISEDES